jgi:hypothetical protein
MTSKKIDGLFFYEASKLKRLFWTFLFTTIASQMLSFSFFALVGKFSGDLDSISDFKGVTALASTFSVFIFGIFATIFLRKYVVKFYVGEQRNRIFLFPMERAKLFRSKTFAFLTVSLSAFFSGLMISLLLEIMANIFIHLSAFNILEVFCSIVICTLFIFVILSFSEIIAIWRQSEIATIVSSVCLVLLASNFLAVGLMKMPILMLVPLVIISGLTLFFILRFSNRLEHVEIC